MIYNTNSYLLAVKRLLQERNEYKTKYPDTEFEEFKGKGFIGLRNDAADIEKEWHIVKSIGDLGYVIKIHTTTCCVDIWEDLQFYSEAV